MTSIIKEAMHRGEASHIGAARSLVQAQVVENRRDRIARRLERRHTPSVAQDLSPSVAEEARLAAVRNEFRAILDAVFDAPSGGALYSDMIRITELVGQLETVTETTETGSSIGLVALPK